ADWSGKGWADDQLWSPLLDALDSSGTTLLVGGRASDDLPPRLARVGRRCAGLSALQDEAAGLKSEHTPFYEAGTGRNPS
ncbi:MAG: hypothetical protein ACF8LK_03420, partial [Phycisphaerales bacterium JB041]